MTMTTDLIMITAVLCGVLFILAGSGGVAALLLFESASDLESVLDVALALVMLAAFASVAFVKADTDDAEERPGQ